MRNQHHTTKPEKEPPYSFTKPALPPLPPETQISEPKSHCPYPFKLQAPPLSVSRNKLDQIVSNISGKIVAQRHEDIPFTLMPPPETQATTTHKPLDPPDKPHNHRITPNPNTRTTTSYHTATGKCQNTLIHRHPQAQHTLTPSSRSSQTSYTFPSHPRLRPHV